MGYKVGRYAASFITHPVFNHCIVLYGITHICAFLLAKQ